MSTPFAFLPETSDIDPQTALNWVRGQADWVALRFVRESRQDCRIRNEKPNHQGFGLDHGVQVEVIIDGHCGYSSTSNLSEAGLKKATQTAVQMTRKAAPSKSFATNRELRPQAVGQYASPRTKSVDALTLEEVTSFLIEASRRLKVSDEIVNREAQVSFIQADHHLVSSSGTNVHQNYQIWMTDFMATAQRGSDSQRRSLNGPGARCVQGGAEVLNREEVLENCLRAGHQALELLAAPDCPSGATDLLLAPDQMMLQIHESIGHPLELDRILGDERNYAGWSFVKPEDFGKLIYGSKLMNATFDPSQAGEFASYAFDDCGNKATREYLIKDGVLQRGLGSLESQKRLGLPGVANFRASSWNRAPIDRMGNINIEPGDSSFEEMLAMVENGVYMESNLSWSIDDYRNKFQFGCEYARLIKNGKLGAVVKNPNYRGITVPFWRSLAAVGREREQFGTPTCGKGEPNQGVRVGHLSPACLFRNVDVFGGGQ